MPLKEIPDHRLGIDTLLRNIRNGRVAHSYLFYGPEGAGKQEAAIAFAQALLCESPQNDGDACGVCRNCRRILPSEDAPDGNHPDVIHLRVGVGDGSAKTRITIAQIKKLQSVLSYSPLEGRYRVVIIHDAETMSMGKGEAANAFLKTLEEPQERNVFLLLAPSPTAIMETVRSRCRLVPFRALPPHVIEEELKSKITMPGAELRLISQLANGSLSAALALAEDKGLEKRHELLRLWLSINSNPPAVMDKIEQEIGSNRDEARNFFELLFVFYRDIILKISVGRAAEDNLINYDFSDDVEKVSMQSDVRALLAFSSEILKRYNELYLNVSVRGAIENLFLNAKKIGVIPE